MNAMLQTERLILRPVQLSDVDLLWPASADLEVSRYMAWEPHGSRDETEAFVRHEVARWESQRGITWTILEQEKFCGIISLIGVMRTHRALRYDKAELGYWLLSSARGRGLMTEAVAAVLEFAFGELGLHKICVSHFAVNDDSRNLISRLGFRLIGEQVAEFQKAGVWHNHVLYELLVDDFRRPRSG